jgi:hypothetical protein
MSRSLLSLAYEISKLITNDDDFVDDNKLK